MARSVTFNGITRIKPGGITKINADALNQIGSSAANVVGLIGESSAGEPGATSGLISLRDPSRAKELFGEGDLVDAIRLAFQSSGDPRIPGGAAEVVIYKTNQSTQSYTLIPNSAAILVSDTDGGASTTTTLSLTTGGLTVDAYIDYWVDVAITSLPVITTLTATAGTTTTMAAAGLTAGEFVGQIMQFDAATTTIALQSEFATVIANDGTSLTFAETLPAVPVAGDLLNVVPNYRRKVTANDATTLTLSDALPAVPASGDAVRVRPALARVNSSNYGFETAGITVDASYSDATTAFVVTVTDNEGNSQVSGSLGGKPFLKVVYQGGANAVAADVIDTSGPPTALNLTLVAGGLTPSAHDGATVLLTNPATGTSEQHRISSNTATDLVLEAPGLSNDFLAEVLAATADTVVVEIKTVTSATGIMVGSNGVATSLSTTITGVTGDDLSIAISASDTLQNLIDSINVNANYLAVAPNGINAQTALASEFDFGFGTTVNIQKDPAVNGDTGFKQDLNIVIDWLNDVAEDADATRVTTFALDGSTFPHYSLAMDDLMGDGLGLTGGVRGVSTNSDWQAGFDKLLTRPIDNVVPLIDEDLANDGFGSTATWGSVSQQLVDHVSVARGAAGVERGAFLGFKGTKTAYIAALNSLNDADVQLVSQNPTVLNAAGTLVEVGPRLFAVMGASMRSGVEEIGEPLTHKFIRTSSITQDNSWDPSDLTDASDLILSGALFAESIPGQGIRWVRDLTTWVKNDNLAYSEGSVRSIVRFLAYNIRTLLENRFTGRKAAPATIAAVKDTVAAALEQYRADGIIVDSTDPATGTVIRAWHNLKVFSDGDVLRVNFGVFPVPGINFQLTEIFLQLPTQSA